MKYFFKWYNLLAPIGVTEYNNKINYYIILYYIDLLYQEQRPYANDDLLSLEFEVQEVVVALVSLQFFSEGTQVFKNAEDQSSN